jgi:hypothetical protein
MFLYDAAATGSIYYRSRARRFAGRLAAADKGQVRTGLHAADSPPPRGRISNLRSPMPRPWCWDARSIMRQERHIRALGV